MINLIQSTNYYLGEAKSDYEIYHSSYTAAVEEIRKYAALRGYELSDDDMFDQIGVGPAKPQEGTTNRFSLVLFKDGVEQKKRLQVQIYGMGKGRYELNMYIA